MYIINDITSSSKIEVYYIIAEMSFTLNKISAIIYIYYILDEVITIYTVNKEFLALVRWELLILIGLLKLFEECSYNANIKNFWNRILHCTSEKLHQFVW